MGISVTLQFQNNCPDKQTHYVSQLVCKYVRKVKDRFEKKGILLDIILCEQGSFENCNKDCIAIVFADNYSIKDFMF
jgi:delta-aminolevulinic acid dehydratase/porphobilinogen synthase